MREPQVGSVFAGHKIEAVAGRGGMGVVYRARNLILDQERAIKVITASLSHDRAFRERFKREARLAALLKHSNVIPVFHAGEEQGLLYVAMEFVAGTDLRKLLDACHFLDVARAIRILSQVGAALDAAHAAGLVHRDVKPANVLIANGEPNEHAYLTDFGLSRHVSSESAMTETGQFLGTYWYSAPEQFDGAVGSRADIYSLGCMLYEVLAGNVPFQRDSPAALMAAHLMAPPPAVSAERPGLSAKLDSVIAKALAKDPATRYDSAAALFADVTAAFAPGRKPAVCGSVGAVTTAGAKRWDKEPVALAGSGEQDTDAIAVGRSRPDPLGGHVPASSPRRQWRAFSVALAALAAFIIGFLLLRGGPSAPHRNLEPERKLAVSTLDAGARPQAVADWNGEVFVASKGDHNVTVLDANSRQLLNPGVLVGFDPEQVAVSAGGVWAFGRSQFRRIDPPNFDVHGPPQTIQGGPFDVATAGRDLWIVRRAADSLVRLDPTNEVFDLPGTRTGSAPTGVAFGAGSLWVANRGDRDIQRFNPKSLETEGGPVPVPGGASRIEVGEGAVWVLGARTVTRIDPETERIKAQIRLDGKPMDIAVGEGAVWVSDYENHRVLRIDPTRNAVTGPGVEVGNGPLGLAVGDGAVWVANSRDATVSRIRP